MVNCRFGGIRSLSMLRNCDLRYELEDMKETVMTKDSELDTRSLLKLAEGEKKSYEEVRKRWIEADAENFTSSNAAIPEFEHVHDVFDSLLRPCLESGASVLDIGAATGEFAKKLLQEYPRISVTLTDISPQLLTRAERELKEYQGRFDIADGDCFTSDVDFPNRSFDCIVSVLSIHHGQGIDADRTLYAKVHRWLKPNGQFVCCDHVLGDNFDLTVLNAEGWRNHLLKTPLAKIAHGVIKAGHKEDNPLTIREYVRELENVGFGAVDVLWKKFNFVLYVGVKSA